MAVARERSANRHRNGRGNWRLSRRLRLVLRRYRRTPSLSRRFLLMAIPTIAICMAVLGHWTSLQLEDGITIGVGRTAAASIEAIVSSHVRTALPGIGDPLIGPAALDEVFRIGNDADKTRLLHIRIRSLSGEKIYESPSGLVDPAPAALGEAAPRIVDVQVGPVGPVAQLPITVLKIVTPLRDAGTGEDFAFADLYFAADAILELQAAVRNNVWMLVGGAGALITGVLYLFVNSLGRTIDRQRTQLSANLVASRALAAENLALKQSADALRLAANAANENLLTQVGSDLHDGPIQLLSLTMLGLGKARATGQSGLDAPLATVAAVIDELRGISAGLVLPELAAKPLGETIAMAVDRHQNLTGTRVETRFEGPDVPLPASVKITAYRVVQEALRNAHKHAGGRGQRVFAHVAGDWLTLVVENEAAGAGGAEALAKGPQLGLAGMRFRVESLGGALSVTFGKTTRVVARIPLSSNQLPPVPQADD